MFNEFKIDPIFSVEKSTFEMTKRELQVTQLKVESLSNEARKDFQI